MQGLNALREQGRMNLGRSGARLWVAAQEEIVEALAFKNRGVLSLEPDPYPEDGGEA